MDSLNECIILSEKIIKELIEGIRKYMGIIYKIIDSIAFLDMMISFTTYITIRLKITKIYIYD